MKIIRSAKTLQKYIRSLKQNSKTVGFVPTMGALHEGHLSLIRKSRRENDIVVASIFINPTQFGQNEDFSSYPREEKKDKMSLKKEKTDILFLPVIDEMYPEGFSTFVEVKELDQYLCGQYRAGHFQGVTTVVCKLLNLVSPDALYLGQKDIQQAVIIQKMIKDLNLPVHLRICPTQREKSGLALSSRNKYLDPLERKEAAVLYKSLRNAKKMIEAGELDVKKIQRQSAQLIKKNSTSVVQYFECVSFDNLKPFKKVPPGKSIIALAAYFGKTRLIDNIIVNVKKSE